ncbi:MAG: porin family protein [Calothrix sp. CSU_2_0]|nr:porin family protein [Calothrix sp. CSU_2_0]
MYKKLYGSFGSPSSASPQSHDISKISLHHPAKPTINQPEDFYEQAEIQPLPLVQRKLDTLIQREPEDDKQPHVDVDLLPPKVKASLGQFNLTADTGTAKLGYQPGNFGVGLGYNYGGNIFADAKSGDFSAQLDVNPASGNLSLGGSYNQFNFGANYNQNGSFGVNLGYGIPLLPMPDTLSQTVIGGEKGLRGIGSGLPGAMDNPLDFYRAQSDNITKATDAGKMLGDIASQQDSKSQFGAGFSLTSNPEAQEQFRAMLLMQGKF